MNKFNHVLEMKSASVTTAAAMSISDFSFTQRHLDRASGAIISCATNSCMITLDGTDPTSTVGHLIVKALGPGDWLMLDSAEGVQQIKLLGISGTSVVTITLVR